MLDEYIKGIGSAQNPAEYKAAMYQLAEYLKHQGKENEAENIRNLANVRENRFSKRETEESFHKKKEEVMEYCRLLCAGSDVNRSDRILTLLTNFPRYCKKLYIEQIHGKCSDGVKNHLLGFLIENEFDLQRLMLPVFSAYYPDARTETVQDSGHHAVRKDIVIDSEETVIELKCTRKSMTERQLGEEIAADIIHYRYQKLYFYVYDKAGIIHNPASFQGTYEKQTAEKKTVKMVIYDHNDI